MHYQHCYLLDKLIGFEYNGNRYIYQKNIQGDIIKIYNEETQELEAEYDYDVWENIQYKISIQLDIKDNIMMKQSYYIVVLDIIHLNFVDLSNL